MKQKLVNGRWMIWTTDAIADWDGPTGDPVARRGWEYARLESLHRHTFRGFTMYEVGAEHGWLSTIIGREFVGPENMVLFEPSPELWVNIRKHWQHNNLPNPVACWPGFVGETSSVPRTALENIAGLWPAAADPHRNEVPAMAYRSLADAGEIETVSLDDFAAATEIVPNGFNIDVEGAELLVLRGAEQLLANEECLGHVWVSIHPDLMEQFDHTPEELHGFMDMLGWTGEHLGTDHEEHWRFWRVI